MPIATSRPPRKEPDHDEEEVRKPQGKIPFWMEDEIAKVLVLEEPPMKLRISWNAKRPEFDPSTRFNDLGPKYDSFKVATPWCYFMARFTKAELITHTFIFFSEKKVEKITDKLFLPPLPNIYPAGHICTGTIRTTLTDSPEKKMLDLFRGFWTTPFNLETSPSHKRYIPKAFELWGASARIPKSILFAWEAASIEGTPIDWKPYKAKKAVGYRRVLQPVTTLKDTMEYALGFPFRMGSRDFPHDIDGEPIDRGLPSQVHMKGL